MPLNGGEDVALFQPIDHHQPSGSPVPSGRWGEPAKCPLRRAHTLPEPCTSKHVRWGDTLGKPLARQRLYKPTDETWRCNQDGGCPLIVARRTPSPVVFAPTLCPRLSFADTLPPSDDELLACLARNAVQLESLVLQSPRVLLTIRVLNLAFKKRVFLRVTDDEWATHRDIECAFESSTPDLREDRFVGRLSAPLRCPSGHLQFAIGCQVAGRDYWDNNAGTNYTIGVESVEH